MSDESYFDVDGNPVSLYRLVKTEPQWACSMIREMHCMTNPEPQTTVTEPGWYWVKDEGRNWCIQFCYPEQCAYFTGASYLPVHIPAIVREEMEK